MLNLVDLPHVPLRVSLSRPGSIYIHAVKNIIVT